MDRRHFVAGSAAAAAAFAVQPEFLRRTLTRPTRSPSSIRFRLAAPLTLSAVRSPPYSNRFSNNHASSRQRPAQLDRLAARSPPPPSLTATHCSFTSCRFPASPKSTNCSTGSPNSRAPTSSRSRGSRQGPWFCVVNDQTPYKTIKELVDDAKKNPDKLIFSSSGLYGALHLPTALFMKAAGIQMKHLPTNGGGPALTAILGNNAQVLVSSIAAASGQIKAGKLRALACFSPQRAASMPDVPTLKELGYDVEFSLWVGVFAPKNTPAVPSSKCWATLSSKRSAGEQFKTAINNIGDEVAYLDQAAFAKFWDEDAKRVEAAVHAIGRVQG